MKEVDLGKLFIDWIKLNNTNAEVFQEVDTGYASCDVVTRLTIDKDRHVVNTYELKLHLNWAVLKQADRWRPKANSYIVCPCKRGFDKIQLKVVKLLGLGLIGYETQQRYPNSNTFFYANKIEELENSSDMWKESLRRIDKDRVAAGSRSGDRMTPFKRTIRRLRKTVKHNKGITIKEAVLLTKHHYANTTSAVQCIKKLILKGDLVAKVKGDKLYKIGLRKK